jgi:flagellar hook-associated protein 2
MATITSTGLGSNLDVGSIITSLMAVESKPLALLQTAATKLNTQVSAIGQLKSLTTTMRDAAAKLASVSLWNQTTTSSSDSSFVSATGASGAATANYSVTVANLATSQTVASRSFTNASTTLGAGLMTIELGTWDGEPTPTGFTPKGSGGGTLALEATDTLTDIRDKINAAGMGVTASIINDASGARLALRSTETGALNGFRISTVEDANDGVANTGLSALAYDAAEDPLTPEPVSQMTRSETAVNASATVNGIGISSASNVLENVADGLTLTLAKPTTSTIQVAVKADTEAVKTAITAFTTAFNALATFIGQQTKYDPATKVGGTLQGDRATSTVLTGLRGVINQSTSASSTFGRLSDIGITMKADGTLETNSTKLEAALGNRAELQKALATDGTDSAGSGFMDRFRDLGAALLDTEGSLTTRTSSLESMLARNSKSQEAMENRLAATKKRLETQYQVLDTNMAKLTSLSSYLTNQLASLNINSSS